MNLRKRLKLYVITDRRIRDEIETVKEALEGGATAIQMRIKNTSTKEMVEVGKNIRKITEDYDALFFVNDRVDVALTINADGVHLGSDDMPVSLAKEIASNLIIGASAYSFEKAVELEKEADYLGVGSIFPTKTKDNVKVIGVEGLRKIAEHINIPIVAIGGINHRNVEKVLKTGVDGVSVISAILKAQSMKEATEDIKKILVNFSNVHARI